MAITDGQKVDYLLKKIGYGISKTDTLTNKSPANESIASPLLIRGDTVWQQSSLISTVSTLPTANTSVISVYRDTLSSTVQATNDGTSATNRTWKTNLTDWVGPEFGAGYAVKVYTGVSGSATPQSLTALPVDGSGNNDSWYFDYQSGVLNFADTNVPSTIGVAVYVSGARYVGSKGLATFPNGLTIGNLSISGNSISSSSGNVFINGNLTISGNSVSIGSTSLSVVDPIINVHSPSDLTALISNDNYDIGLKLHYYDTIDSAAFLGRANDTGFLEWYSRGNDTGNVFVGTAYGTIKSGEMLLANTTASTSTSTGALRVSGGAGIVGNLFVGNISTGIISASGNVSMSNLLTNGFFWGNGVPVIFSNYSNANVTLLLSNFGSNTITTSGNITAGNIIATYTTNGNIRADIISPYQTTVTTFNSSTAIGLPTGANIARPSSPIAGYIRYNDQYNAVEFYNGAGWVSVVTNIDGENFFGNGTSTYTLRNVTTANGILVSINGTVQQPTYAYSVSGTTLTFTEAPTVTDQIDIRYLAVSQAGDNIFNTDVSITGNITVTGLYSSTPTTKTATSPGVAGQICWDANYIYVCTAANTWKRSALTGGF